MTNLKKLAGTSTQKEEEGVWEDYLGGIRLKIARVGNPRAKAKMAELLHEHRDEVMRGTLDSELNRQLTLQVAASAILVGWSGITDDDGNPVPYSPEKALEFLSDPELHDFAEEVSRLASRRERFRLDAQEEAAKNS